MRQASVYLTIGIRKFIDLHGSFALTKTQRWTPVGRNRKRMRSDGECAPLKLLYDLLSGALGLPGELENVCDDIIHLQREARYRI